MHLGSLRQTGPACRSDLDSHADASVVGMEVITFQNFERPVNVSGYDPKGPVAMDLKTVSAGMAYVRSSTALDIFSLEGKLPDTIVKGQTSDISPLAEYAWYEWVKFRDTGQSFPDSK
jgi:hypothetical protein